MLQCSGSWTIIIRTQAVHARKRDHIIHRCSKTIDVEINWSEYVQRVTQAVSAAALASIQTKSTECMMRYWHHAFMAIKLKREGDVYHACKLWGKLFEFSNDTSVKLITFLSLIQQHMFSTGTKQNATILDVKRCQFTLRTERGRFIILH